MEDRIIEPVEIDKIIAELTPDKFLRHTNRGGNEIFVVDAFNSPNVMREVGRLREMTFRAAGGGTGKECDIDEFDTMDVPCRQMIVWNPEERMILGGYRFILGKDMTIKDGAPNIATAHMFNFSDEFIRDYLPYTIELGRSFVRVEYQSSKAGARAIFALDNLWDGLGALTVENPEIKYLFGKMTMYPSYNTSARDMLLYFLNHYFPDNDNLVTPKEPLKTLTPPDDMQRIFSGDDFKKDFKILNAAIRETGFSIPPLINAYMSLSPTMKLFGTGINHEFGEVEETGILISISDIFEEKKKRHIESYHHIE
ncbi:MAG: GNAT family N-acetyltransferase [Muribaculaceae bacterium]|nr:GNAT family N-acetyltransferase [Muribaculaceae bacterium]